MKIEIREVRCKNELKQFIYLPARIYKNNSVWVPPIYSDEWKYFNKKNTNIINIAILFYFLLFVEKRLLVELWVLSTKNTIR